MRRMTTRKIEWTDATWNPVRGCSAVSEGCRNCYAARQAARFRMMLPGAMTASGEIPQDDPLLADYDDRGHPRWTGLVGLADDALDAAHGPSMIWYWWKRAHGDPSVVILGMVMKRVLASWRGGAR